MPRPALSAGTVTLVGREVPRIGYGLGSLTRSAENGPEAFQAGVELLHHAADVGITLFDTAQFYGAGLANRLLAAAFGDRWEQVVIASKVGARPLTDGPVPMTAAQRPHELREAVEDNLGTLGTDHLDLVYLRRMDMTPGLVIPDGDEQQVDLDDQLSELVAMRDEGLIAGIGLSHVSLDQLTRALPAGIVAVSNIHNLLRRDDEPLLAVAEEHGIVWSPYFPLGGGGYAGLPRVVEDPRVLAVAAELDVTPNQVGLAWVLARSPQSVVIAGTSREEHLDENVAAAALDLDAEVMARLG